ncbi:hypothetical protein MG293_020291, partial [Ovis ammon polii]
MSGLSQEPVAPFGYQEPLAIWCTDKYFNIIREKNNGTKYLIKQILKKFCSKKEIVGKARIAVTEDCRKCRLLAWQDGATDNVGGVFYSLPRILIDVSPLSTLLRTSKTILWGHQVAVRANGFQLLYLAFPK